MRKYVPLSAITPFHTDQTSRIKVLSGQVGTGTSTAMAMEILRHAEPSSLLILPDTPIDLDMFQRTCRDWWESDIHNDGDSFQDRWLDLCVIGPEQVSCLDLAHYPSIYMAGVSPYHPHFYPILEQADKQMLDTTRMAVEIKSVDSAVRPMPVATVYRLPPVLVTDEHNNPMINPDLEVWHMPQGRDWFEGIYINHPGGSKL